MNETLGGAIEVALNGITIPATLLSEVTVELMETTRERSTLAGNFSRPGGILDSAQATFTLFLPSIDYLKDIFPERYNSPTAPQTSGNIIWDTDTCTTIEGSPINFHYVCDQTDDNDIHFYEGRVQLNFNPTFNQSDDLSIEVTVFALPDTDGRVYRLGTGDLTQPSVYDAETMETVPLASS
jgi:hypothetical protein